ncbi:MAG: ABC transporter permease [Oscillospiraceae bacterium]|nr:ABC transporter permease [Oscillospiraceae bacterium]
MDGAETFVTPTFGRRVGSMLRLDFYRLFHTPVLFAFLAIAAIIPAMVLSLSGVDMSPPNRSAHTEDITAITMPIYGNAWQMVESTANPMHAVNADDGPIDMGRFMNINMLFIFAGVLMSIFVAHDYGSGFVKNIFAVHPRKADYVISKTAIGLFGGAGMILTYLLGTVAAGLLTGKAFDVDVGGLVCCLISKALLMGVFCSLFAAVAMFFRKSFWVTVVVTFVFGMMLYPAASVATLDSTVATVLTVLAASAVGTLAIGSVSGLILRRRDLA